MSDRNEDHILVQLLQKGDVVAFDTLFEFYSPKLFGFALKYLKCESDSEELVQEVFVQVWEHRKSLKSTLSFKSYLFTIALNQIRRFFNKRAISLRYIESLNNNPDTDDSQNDNYEGILQQVNLIIEKLPPRRREIFLRSKIEGKSAKEIAAELNIAAGTVDNQVSEALRFIRTQLGNEKLSLILFAVLFIY